MDKDSAREILKSLLNLLRYRVPVQRLPKILRELYKETIWEEQANGFTDEAAADFMCWIEKALEIAVKTLGEKENRSDQEDER